MATREKWLQLLDSKQEEAAGSGLAKPEAAGSSESENGGVAAPKVSWRALFDARQRKLLALAEVDPQAARAGLALCLGLEAAYRGDLGSVTEALEEADDALQTAGYLDELADDGAPIVALVTRRRRKDVG